MASVAQNGEVEPAEWYHVQQFNSSDCRDGTLEADYRHVSGTTLSVSRDADWASTEFRSIVPSSSAPSIAHSSTAADDLDLFIEVTSSGGHSIFALGGNYSTCASAGASADGFAKSVRIADASLASSPASLLEHQHLVGEPRSSDISFFGSADCTGTAIVSGSFLEGCSWFRNIVAFTASCASHAPTPSLELTFSSASAEDGTGCVGDASLVNASSLANISTVTFTNASCTPLPDPVVLQNGVVVRSATVLHRCAAPSINVGAAVGCAVASVIILASIFLMAYSRSRSRKSDEDLSNTGNQAVQQEADATKRRKTCRLCRKIWLVCRGIVMTTLTAAALTVIVVGILGGFTSFTGNNVADFVLFIADVSLLGMMEGLQIALLQVSAADCKALKYACPAVWQCYELTKGPLMDDWLCGRQLLTIFCVYVSARLTTFIGVDFWPFTTTPVPDWFQTAILDTGLPGALVTVCIGQLVPQIIASPHPVQFLKLPGCVPVIKLAKLLYSVGLTHLAKGLVHLFSKAACLRKHALVVTESAGTEQVDAVNAAQDGGDVKDAGDGELSNKTVAVGGDPDCGKPHPVKAHSTRSKRIADAAPTVELEGGEDLVVAAPVSSGDDDDDDDSTGSPSGRQESSTGEALLPRTPVWTVCDSCRFAVMVVVSLCALAFLCGAIWLNYSNFAGPGWSHLLILACMICILAYLEGLQVALIQGSKIRPHSRLNGIALRNFRRTQDPVALMRFMSGRQVFVILTVYLITQITTFPTLVTLPFFDDVVLPSWFLDGILSPGIPAVLLVASLGQLLPQLLATQFPSFVLQACASNVVIWCALALDACGFTVVAWMVSESTVFYARLPATPTLQRTYIDHSKLQVIHYVYDLLDSEDGDCVETADLEVGLQEQLVEGCDEGLEMVPISDTTDLAANASSNNGSNRNSRTASLDSDHHGAGDFDPLESSGYPTPTQLAIQVLEASDSNTVPRFLLPPGHDKHVPPHVVAFQLMQQQDINGSGQLHMEGTGGEPSQADDIA